MSGEMYQLRQKRCSRPQIAVRNESSPQFFPQHQHPCSHRNCVRAPKFRSLQKQDHYLDQNLAFPRVVGNFSLISILPLRRLARLVPTLLLLYQQPVCFPLPFPESMFRPQEALSQLFYIQQLCSLHKA